MDLDKWREDNLKLRRRKETSRIKAGLSHETRKFLEDEERIRTNEELEIKLRLGEAEAELWT